MASGGCVTRHLFFKPLLRVRLFAVDFAASPGLHHAFPIGLVAGFTLEDIEVAGKWRFHLIEGEGK